MALGTLDRTPPPFFRQGASALSKLILCSALALFLMVADARFKITQPVRVVIAATLYPVQWLLTQPALWLQASGEYFQTLSSAQSQAAAAKRKLDDVTVRALEADQLVTENNRLRQLLEIRQRITSKQRVAQVLYDAADPYSRKVIIDKGMVDGLLIGSPVIDEHGVLGQITRTYPSVSEVTLLIDADQAIPVLNTRTGSRSVAFGDPTVRSGGLELRFLASNADVQPGDLLTTSGVDGVYPAGLPVAKVARVDRLVQTAFAKIYCEPQALMSGSSHVMVLDPITDQKLPPRPVNEPTPVVVKKGRQK
jgi:rod shape-determining protein MreC